MPTRWRKRRSRLAVPPQSRPYAYKLLLEGSGRCGKLARLGFVAAMTYRGSSMLHRDGLRILSLFEVLVFTSMYHRCLWIGTRGGARPSTSRRRLAGSGGWSGSGGRRLLATGLGRTPRSS